MAEPDIVPQLPIDLPEVGDHVVGMAGQLVSAVLQTAGIYGQSEVLEVFHNALHDIGALVYTFCALGAIASVALFGNYKKAGYFLLGPAMFFWMIRTTVPAEGTVWQFGDRLEEGKPERMLNLLKFPSGPSPFSDKMPNVSYFYAVYDHLVSSVIQQLVTVLVDTKNKEDLIYVARERVYMQLLRAQGTELEFIKLLSKGLMGGCGRQALLIHQLAEEYKGPIVDRQNLPDDYIPPPATGQGLGSEELQRLWEVELERVKHTKVTLELDIRRYISTVLYYHRVKMNDPDLTAKDKEILKTPGRRFMNTSEGLQLGDGTDIPEQVTCSEVWRYTTLASWKSGEEYLTNPAYRTEYPGIPWDEAREWVLQALVYDKEHPRDDNGGVTHSSKVPEIVAAYIIRNTLSNNIYGQVAKTFEAHEGWDKDIYRGIFGGTTPSIAWGEREVGREKIVYFAGTIPYLQGVLLFLLSLAFPFFALFLLMPTHCHTFLVWLSLWLWVKSWDVGFAICYYIRHILWQFMATDPGAKVNIESMDWQEKPQLVFAVMLQNDPLANLNTYYHLVSLITVSVPFLSAHLCLGAADLFGVLRSSADTQATKFSKRVGRAARRMIATPIGRYQVEFEANYAKRAVADALTNPGKNMLGESRAIWRKGDRTRLRYADMAQQLALVQSHYASEQMKHRNFLAAVTGRKMVYDPQLARNVIQAFVGLVNERHVGPDQYRNWAGVPFMFDARAPSDEDNVSISGLASRDRAEGGYDIYNVD